MRVKTNKMDDAEVQMAPLIDCVFLLLIFFLVAATLKQAHNEVDVIAADSSAAMEPDPDYKWFVVEAREDGLYYVNLDPVEPAVLQERLREIAAERPDTVVRIDGDRRTAFQHVVRLLDMCKFEGLKNIVFRTGD